MIFSVLFGHGVESFVVGFIFCVHNVNFYLEITVILLCGLRVFVFYVDIADFYFVSTVFYLFRRAIPSLLSALDKIYVLYAVIFKIYVHSLNNVKIYSYHLRIYVTYRPTW